VTPQLIPACMEHNCIARREYEFSALHILLFFFC